MRRWTPLAAAAVVLAVAVAVPALGTLAPGGSGTVYACVNSNHQFTHVNVGAPLACPSQQPVSWPVTGGGSPSPSPSATTPAPSPSPSATSASPSPSATAPSGAQCVVTQPTGTPCNLAAFPGITGSNGSNTQAGNNCWADPSCTFTSTFYDPGNWNVVAKEPAGNTAVMAYPTVQQLYDYPALSSLPSLASSYAEDMGANSGTIAWAAYDVWLNNWADEVLIAVDNHGIDPSYLPVVGHFTAGGQGYTLYDNGSERVAVADVSQQSGTVDILAVLGQVQALGKLPASNTLSGADFGWEVCSTGGQQERFTVSSYSLTSG